MALGELPREAESGDGADLDLVGLVVARCMQALGAALIAAGDLLETGEVGELLAPPNVCAGCERKPERPPTIVSGFVFCTASCFHRRTLTACTRCGQRVFLIYSADRDHFYNQCSCGQPAVFEPRPDSRVTTTKDQRR